MRRWLACYVACGLACASLVALWLAIRPMHRNVGVKMLWGVVVFGTWPDRTAWVGMALICGAGLYTLWRETVRKKDVDVAAPSGDI